MKTTRAIPSSLPRTLASVSLVVFVCASLLPSPARAEGPSSSLVPLEGALEQPHNDAAQLPGEALEARLDRAREVAALGNIDRAQILYDSILRAHPNLPWLCAEVGLMLSSEGRFGRALPYLQRAIELDSLDIDSYVALANAHDGLGQNAEAIRLYRRSLLLAPDHVDARFNLGRLLYVTGELDKAEAAYRDLIARHADHWKAYNNLGLVLLERGEPTAAMAPLRSALKLKPNDPGVIYNLGRAYAKRNQHDKALKLYARAIEAWGPSDLAAAPLHFAKGNSLFALGRFELAVASYRNAVAIDTEYLDAQLNLGAALANLGRYDDAIAAFELALAFRSDKAAIYRQMALCHLHDKDFVAALAALDKSPSPDNGEYWDIRAKAQLALGRTNEARAAQKRACALGVNASCP